MKAGAGTMHREGLEHSHGAWGAEPGTPPTEPGPRQGAHRHAGRGLGSPSPTHPSPGLALSGKGSKGSGWPLLITSGLQHPSEEAGANQSQMWGNTKMLMTLTRKSPIYGEIMK